ncbi:hypothetical protein BBJ28_00010420 [Nothophytophthora sp. Chile5]|nr:hypothetical protein BBJ28_00010420 [Nothophytophthora sp. Chile5]
MADTHHDPGGGDGGVDDTNRERFLEQIIDATQSELTQLWSAFGLSEEEQQQQQIVLSAKVEKACEARLNAWRGEIGRATTRVDELEGEIRVIQRQFQRNEVRNNRVAEMRKLQAQLGRLDQKLGTDTTFLPPGENDLPDLSDHHKEILQNLVQSKLLEVLAQELQMESDQIFDAELDVRLKVIFESNYAAARWGGAEG